MPVLPEAENGTLTDNDRVRRVRGRELADVLCGMDGGGERAAPPDGAMRTVGLLCSVFDLASRSPLVTAFRMVLAITLSLAATWQPWRGPTGGKEPR